MSALDKYSSEELKAGVEALIGINAGRDSISVSLAIQKQEGFDQGLLDSKRYSDFLEGLGITKELRDSTAKLLNGASELSSLFD